MIFNKNTKTKPFIAHAPGKLKYVPLWKDVISLSNLRPYSPTVNLKDLSVVTFNNGKSHNEKPVSLFESIADLCQLKYDVLGKSVKKWSNKVKVNLLNDHLKSVSTDYILVLDSSDVFLLRSLEGIVKEFKQHDCQALFNAEKIIWPLDLSEEIKSFEESIHPGFYLNAGAWIAYSKFAKELLQIVSELKVDTSHLNSEQVYYKYAYKLFYPKIKVDVSSSIFQGLNRVNCSELSLLKLF